MKFFYKNLWILSSFICIVYAWDETKNLKTIGEKEFLRLKKKSSLQHGVCWHKALKNLKSSCDKLNDNEHSLLAISLANCFLEDSGHKTYDCQEKINNDDRRECINKMSDRAFGVYNEFYIHASHICYFLNHEIWQAETYDTIKHLYEASSIMKEQLQEASLMQETLLESQKKGLDMQNELLDHGKELGNIIQISSESVSNMVFDFKESVKDQKELLFQIFDYLRTFQDWIITEVSWFQSILYYTISCILSALFTASKRTANARIVLFTSQSLNVIIERMFIQCYDSNNIIDKTNLNYYIWSIRKIILLISTISLFYCYCTYKDECFENFKLLKSIENRLNSLHDLDVIKAPLPRSTRRATLKKLKNKYDD